MIGDEWASSAPEEADLLDYEDDGEGCCECGGEGWIEADCDEDTCCCLEPHEMIPCSLCNPEGK